jgi:hypothetical protein
MEASSDVLASLEARAEERSLSDLEKRGRTKLRVIRKREIAALVQEAVDRAIASSEWVPPEKLDELRKRSEREFSDLKTEWESERGEHARLETELGQERERNQELEDVAAGLREELDEAQQRIAELEELTEGAASESQGGAAMSLGGDATSAMLMMKMMEEIQALKSQAQTPAPAPTGEDPGIASKLDQLVSGLDAKLETFGKKMGISSAVDSSEVDYSGLFEKDSSNNVETNMGDVEVEQRKGGGIAANLERMKKLRGGG